MPSKKKTKKKKEEIREQEPTEVSEPEADAALEAAGAGEPEAVEAAEADELTPEQVIDALTSELTELEDRHLRLVAEFDNFRKRTIRERAQQEHLAQAGLLKQLLESLDDLARVCELGSTDHDAAAILEGVHLVEMKLRRALEQSGLKPIEAVGQRFNPELHDAMVTVPTAIPEEDEIVAQELAKGYMFKDKLLRPSLVQVKMYRPEAEGGGPGEAEDGS
jgi:molecular chaperone GrpE